MNISTSDEKAERKRGFATERGVAQLTLPALRRNALMFHVELTGNAHGVQSTPMDPSRKLKTNLHLRKVFPFKYLDDILVDKVIERMIRVSVRGGDAIVRKGDTVANFFVIESGVYEELFTAGGSDIILCKYDSWGCFQQEALVHPFEARSTITARTDGVLWSISCCVFRALASEHDEAQYSTKVAYLQQVPYISDLPSSDLNRLVDGVECLRFKKGAAIISGTADAHGLYRLNSGSVRIGSRNHPSDGHQAPSIEWISSKIVGPGAIFGDLPMFCLRLTAEAVEPCEMFRLSALAFERLLGPFNELSLAGRLKNRGEPQQWHTRLQTELEGLVGEYEKHGGDFLEFGCEFYRHEPITHLSGPDSTERSQAIEDEPRRNKLEDVTWQQASDQRSGSGQTAKFQSVHVIKHPQPVQEHNYMNFTSFDPQGSAPSLETMTYTIAKASPTEHQRKIIRSILKSVPMFKPMDDPRLDKVASAMRLVKVYCGHYVVKSHMRGTHFYIVEEGNFKTLVSGVGVTHEILECPAHFGELGLIADVPRFADVVAVTNGKVWALSRESFRQISESVPLGKRKANHKLIQSISGLENWNPYVLKALSSTLETINYEDRDILCGFDDDPACVFIVKQGTVRVYSKTIKNKSKLVKKGESFGSLIFSVGKPEELKAQSIGRSKVARLPISSFEKLLAHCRQVLFKNKCLPPT